MIPITNAEIDALLDRARPDRYNVDNHNWRDAVVDKIAHRIPARQAAQVAAERLVADREGRATRSANQLLRRIAEEHQWPLDGTCEVEMNRPLSIGNERSKRWALMERFEVPDFDRPDVNYLERLRIIATPLLSIYLHRLGTPDSRPTLHDHPWCFVSLILRGGYDEIRLNKHTMTTYRRRIRFINVMRRDDAHYIETLHRTPTWSLLFVGARRRTWGYWRPLDVAVPPPRGAWYWTPFDRDVHAAEFDAAMQERRAA